MERPQSKLLLTNYVAFRGAQSEVRAHLAAMKGNKVSFVEKHATDPRVASAVFGAPPFLSGLTEADVALMRTSIEQHVAPEVAKARDDTLKALQEAEQGWQKAIEKISERAGLSKVLTARGLPQSQRN